MLLLLREVFVLLVVYHPLVTLSVDPRYNSEERLQRQEMFRRASSQKAKLSLLALFARRVESRSRVVSYISTAQRRNEELACRSTMIRCVLRRLAQPQVISGDPR